MPFTKADLAISTMWNFRKAHSGEELIDQLRELGFSRVELNYQVRTEWLSGIRRRIDEGAVTVSSVHNVFPKTLDKQFDTDSVMLGYEDENLRQQAVELAKGSIEWACVLGAGAVVFHPTEVPLDPQAFDVPLKKLIAAHQQDTAEYRDLHARMLAARQAQPWLDRMMKSIDELANYVEKYNLPVRLGMENRAMCHQCPIFSEFDLIAERFGGSPVGIWLDTGHAIMMAEMGLQQLPLSKQAADMIVGMHIHDAADALDHYAPCTLEGDVLAPYREYILRSPIKVLELSGRLSAEEIITGTDRFVERYGRLYTGGLPAGGRSGYEKGHCNSPLADGKSEIAAMSRDILFDHGNARFSCRISALIVQEGRVLLQCPVGTSEYAFVGGHVSFGETAKEALVREIREELHADAVIGDLAAVGEVFIDWGKLPDGSLRHCHQIGLYFRAAVDESQLPAADRFFGYDEAGGERFSIEYLWVPLEALDTLTVYPPEVARHILSGAAEVLHFIYTELPTGTIWPE